MTNRAQAIADLAAASSSVEALGQSVNIDGDDVVCVKRGLTTEEAAAISTSLGMSVKGMRISVDKSLLKNEPVRRGTMAVNGKDYEVEHIGYTGNLLRITLVRYLS